MIKRCACTRCDPVAREAVIHTNGENVLDTAASVASELQRREERKRVVSRGEPREGEGRDDRHNCVNDQLI